jgi:cytoskeletal protein RodZ
VEDRRSPSHKIRSNIIVLCQLLSIFNLLYSRQNIGFELNGSKNSLASSETTTTTTAAAVADVDSTTTTTTVVITSATTITAVAITITATAIYLCHCK